MLDQLGLVTVLADEIDWADTVRIAIQERASLSPDALTGMEQNLRFPGAEASAWICPPSSAVIAGPAPVKGTCSSLMPAAAVSISIATCSVP